MQKLTQRVRCQSDKGNKEDNHISLPDACKLLFLTESTVRYHIIRKRFKAFKSGGRWYLRKDDVETFKKWNATSSHLIK